MTSLMVGFILLTLLTAFTLSMTMYFLYEGETAEAVALVWVTNALIVILTLVAVRLLQLAN